MGLTQKSPGKRADGNEPQHPDCKRRMVRRRPALACEECRARKRRCDGTLPACGGCTKRGSTCIYSSEVQARAWHSSMVQSLRSQLQALEKEVSSSQPDGDSRNNDRNSDGEGLLSQSSQINSTSQEAIATNAESPQIMDYATVHPMATRPKPLEEPATDTTPGTSLPRCIKPCRFEKLMKPINGAIHWDGTNSRTTSSYKLDAVPVATTQNPSTAGCSCGRLLDTTNWRLPARRHADRLVSSFFTTVHLIYPVIHRRSFTKQYEQVWTSDPVCSGLCKQKSRGILFPALVHVIFALGSLFESGPPEQKAARADEFFRLTQKIDLLDVLEDEVSIELVQLGLLMGFYLQSTERFSKCWNITGLTIRLAHNMGLELNLVEAGRQGFLPSSATQLECEMRLRVWYGCYLLDREISMSFGRPSFITTTGDKPRLPEAIDEDCLSDEVGVWNTQPKGLPSLLDSFIHTIKLYEILGYVLDGDAFKDPTASASCDRETSPPGDTSITRSVLDLDTKIMEWRSSLPSHLQYDPSVHSTSPAETITAPSSNFSGQATRLYARFLHVRLLILRPALEQLFERQHRNLQALDTESMETRLQDIMLSKIALECILCADKLTRVLDIQIQLQSFVAWWYNISYLYSCGSTILMGRLCSLDKAGQAIRSLSDSWELCLHCLSQYRALSSVAENSFDLLQESANRLFSRPTREREARSMDKANRDGSSTTKGKPVQSLNDETRVVFSTAEDLEIDMQLPELYPENAGCEDRGVDGATTLDGFGSEMWDMDAIGTSLWSFMPSLSPGEGFPSDF